MASLVLRNVKGSPLTNQEVDDNFNNLNTEVGLKLNSSQYTASNILTLLKTVDGIGSGLDADSVHGYVGDTENSPNSLVARDSNGDFSAETITATTLIGNVQGNVTGNLTGTVTGNASNVNGTVTIEHGGTGGTTQSSARDNLGLGTMAVQSSSSVSITGGSISGISALEIASGGTGGITATQARTNLGLVIGGDIQPFSSVLTVLTNLAPNTDKLPYFNGTSSSTTTDFTSLGRTIVGSSSTSSLRSILGLAIDTDIQAYDADLSAIAALSGTGFLVRTGSGTAATRTLVAGSGLTITNTDGVSGNTTISIPSTAALTVASIAATGQITATGGFIGSFTGTFSGVASNVSGIVALTNGGTGATNAANARSNLGLGTMALQNSSTVAITGGTLSGITSFAATNATLSGTISVGGAATFSSTAQFGGGVTFLSTSNAAGDFSVATNKFTVASVTGNTAVAGTLSVAGTSSLTGNVIFGSAISVTGTTTLGTANINSVIASALSTPSITKSGTNAVGTIGQSNNRFGIVYAASISGAGADLAEKYLADAEYVVGTVMSVGGEKEVTASSEGDRAIGVVSSDPAYIMNDDLVGGTKIALKGRVPVKIVGGIVKGQEIVAADFGCAKAGSEGKVFGIALETNQDMAIKLVECVIL